MSIWKRARAVSEGRHLPILPPLRQRLSFPRQGRWVPLLPRPQLRRDNKRPSEPTAQLRRTMLCESNGTKRCWPARQVRRMR